jgi:hypothetical protein
MSALDHYSDEPERHHAIVELLFPLPASRRTTMGILTWWESRRLAYNIAVGSAGLISLAAIWVLQPLGLPHQSIPWQPIVAFGILANVCYTAGSVAEILAHKLWKDDVLPLGPTLFRHGLIFSAGLALLPTLLAGINFVFHLVKFIFR